MMFLMLVIGCVAANVLAMDGSEIKKIKKLNLDLQSRNIPYYLHGSEHADKSSESKSSARKPGRPSLYDLCLECEMKGIMPNKPIVNLNNCCDIAPLDSYEWDVYKIHAARERCLNNLYRSAGLGEGEQEHIRSRIAMDKAKMDETVELVRKEYFQNMRDCSTRKGHLQCLKDEARREEFNRLLLESMDQ